MRHRNAVSRRAVVRSVGLTLAGSAIAGSVKAADRNRPAQYRWDLTPVRDAERRDELSALVGDVGPLTESHPAFAYETDAERDDHGVDFEALKLYRERNYQEYDESSGRSLGRFVEAFDNDRFEEAKTERFRYARRDAPKEWDREAWLNADDFGTSLDYAHSLLISIDNAVAGRRFGAKTAILREAYRRYHPTYDVLAWSFTMDNGHDDNTITPTGDDGTQVGLVYSPQADELRAFTLTATGFAEDGSLQMHPLIEEWSVTDDPDAEADRGPDSLHHPLLFHTEGWNRQSIAFGPAKTAVVELVNHIGCDPVPQHFDREGRIGLTTGFATVLTRTLLEYNRHDDVEFEWFRNLAGVMELARDRGGNYVFDIAPGSDGYGGLFDGNFAVYEVAYDYVPGLVHADAARELDRFGQVYGGLER
ncbi:hypothetical protein [Haloarcula marina]|uniref:hypothetical protein n=1 Tax=Haloarcula marina TaxID=2961574 RepID=UPI0020B7A72E|nr:hypothetical protein [Halomicroarcula marina]